MALPLLRKGHQLPNITTKIGNFPEGIDTLTGALAAEVVNVATLDTDLTAAGYTAVQLAIMNENDKIYAWRELNSLPHAT